MIEKKLIRDVTYVLAAYMVLNAVHQLITINLLDYGAWIVKAVDYRALTNVILLTSTAIGLFVAGSTFKKHLPALLFSLALAGTYQIALAVANAWEYDLKGSVWITSALIGFLALTLRSYYKVEPDSIYVKTNLDKWKE